MIFSFFSLSVFLIATESQTLAPWWVSAVTGSGGVAVVSSIAAIVLWRELQKSNNENTEMTKQSIEVITKILGKSEEATSVNKEIKAMIEKLLDRVTSADDWKRDMTLKIDNLLRDRS